MRKARICLSVVFALSTVSSSAVHAQTRIAGEFVDGEVVIQFRPGSTALDRTTARNWVAATRKELLRRSNGGDLELAAVPAGMVEKALAQLTRHPAVEFAEPNWIFRHQVTSNDPFYTNGSLWGMSGDTTLPANQYGSQAGEAWAAGHVGSSSVYVGVIDQGIDLNHPDLAANLWTNPFDPVDGIDNDGNGYVDDVHGWDFYYGDNSIYDGAPWDYDTDSHGTHVSGTIGAVGGNGTGVAGVNWNVTIISAKFLGPFGGYLSDAVRAVDYITDLKKRHGLKIVATNNSWGGGGYSRALHEAIIRAANADILFVAAAGNSNWNNDSISAYPANYNTRQGTPTQPGASYDAVIAVASIASLGVKSGFSNYGHTTVDLGAPGGDIWSTTPHNTYRSFNGTSMAAPHVTGATALYASIHAPASALQIKNAILNAAIATPTASLNGITVTGGRLNIGYLSLPTCSYAVTPLSHSVGAGTVELTAEVSTQTDCFWLATSTAHWATITAGRGAGTGTARFSVTPNPDAASRTATLEVAGHLVTVIQWGSSVKLSDSDMIWQHQRSGRLAAWRLSGTTFNSGAVIGAVGDPSWKIASSGHFNGDGDLDILWQHHATGSVAVWFMNGTRYIGGASLGTVGDLSWKLIGADDFTGDGQADLLWHHQSTGRVVIWYMNGTTYTGGTVVGTLGDLSWRIVGIADFNADGKPDILWHHPSAGWVVVWLMNGSSISGGAFVGSVGDVNWRIAGAADFNKDGHGDILWQHQTTGSVVVWLMNRTDYASGATVGEVGDRDWKIVAPK